MNLKKIKTVIAIVLIAMPCFAIKVYQNIDMSGTNVINVPAPIAYTHAVNKEYMDNLAMQATGETNLFSFAVPSKCAGGQISGYTPVSNEDLNISMQFGVNWSTNTRFIVDSTGSNVYDSLTELMWTKNANDADEKNWINAIAYCEALDYGGFDDWRMPNRNELASLIDYSQINPAIPLGHPFTNVQNQNYWTGSTYAKDTEKAWFVSFMNGRLYYFGKGNNLHTWAVRNSVIPFVLQINSPNNGNDYTSTITNSHVTNIIGTVSVIPDSLEYTNLFTGVGGSLPPSKTFNFANELQLGTNIITVHADRGVDSEEVSIVITVKSWNEKTKADPDIVFQPVGITQGIDTIEWDLQSVSAVSNLQYTPFYCAETEITVAQYCRFLNAYKDRFPNKSVPSCAVTSVFNEAQGGAWVDVQTAYQLCQTNDSSYGIKWNNDSTNYEFNVNNAETNEPITKISWYGAVAYCQWLNDVEFGSDTTKWKYRLPTQFEYEFMMGAKTVVSSSGGIQDWGSESWTYGNSSNSLNRTDNSTIYVNCFFDSSYVGLVIVGNKGGSGQNSKNKFECYELSGNVWNWCLDYYGAFGDDIGGKDYVYKEINSKRMIRGGSNNNDASDSRTSHRSSAIELDFNYAIGFRVVRSR